MPKAPRKPKNKKAADPDDDTPRGFKRVMSIKEHYTQPKKPKPVQKDSSASTARPELKIKHGESMAEFSRRVNDAIPLPRAKGVDSKKAMKLSKKQRQKAENLRSEYKQRLEKRRSQFGQESDDEGDAAAIEDDGEDIWAKVNAKAPAPKFGEVADRPPELPIRKQKSSIPKSAGSLARREMLEQERARFIEEYRKLRGNDAGLATDERPSE